MIAQRDSGASFGTPAAAMLVSADATHSITQRFDLGCSPRRRSNRERMLPATDALAALIPRLGNGYVRSDPHHLDGRVRLSATPPPFASRAAVRSPVQPYLIQ